MSNVETDINLNIKIFNNIKVRQYDHSDRDIIEKFRMLAAREGNEALASDKYDADTVDGQTWMTFVDNELASISVVERSHYTEDSNIAGRICRYHILKKFRHSNAGFRMLPDQIKWAKEKNLKVLYWTHSVNNKALNELYQHKRKMPFRGEQVPYFMTEDYKNFKLQKDMLFKVSEKSNFLQYVYANILEENFIWRPTAKTIIYFEHNGEEITDEIKEKLL